MTQKFDYNQDKKKFTKEMLNDTIKYQKQYGFDIGKNNNAHNNEADAFRHTYMQSMLAQKYGEFLTRQASNLHELKGNIQGQDPHESNMDMWNNQQGQQIYNEILREYPNFKNLPEIQRKNIIAKKVIQRMKAGKLITNPNDKRQYKKEGMSLPYTPTRDVGGVWNNGQPMGYASPVDFVNNSEQLGLIIPESVRNQLNGFDIAETKSSSDLSDSTNSATGGNRIFTREDLAQMSQEEFDKNEKAIMAQLKDMNGLPTNDDMRREVLSGGAIYVNPYTRSDGTDVKGYYRSRPKF